MRLGTRWRAGAEPPARLPDAVLAAIRSVEAEQAGRLGDRSWTLTWLEGQPVVELDPAGDSEPVTVIHYHRDADRATMSAGNSGEERVEE